MDQGSCSTSSPTSRSSRIIHQLNESLYELHKPRLGTLSVQVLFFHGFQRGEGYKDAHLSTWKSGDGTCVWPQTWLADEFSDAHVLTVSYNSDSLKSKEHDPFIIGENVMSDLLQINVGQDQHCPIVLVGHSFGGLVIKQLCLQAKKKGRLEHNNFLKNVKGLFFYSTPHNGIRLKVAKRFAEGALLEFIKVLSASAARLNDDFEQLRKQYTTWRIAGVGEKLPMKLSLFRSVVVVPEGSSRYGEDFRLVTDANHLTICRPMRKTSASFNTLISLLRVSITSQVGALTNSLSSEEPDIAALQNCLLTKARSLVIREDAHNRYVPLREFESEIQSALDNPNGPQVILLHGGAGEGKSTLARQIALHYNSKRKTPTDRTVALQDGFQLVIYLECGPNVAILPKQSELLTFLGWNTVSPLDKEQLLLDSRSRIPLLLEGSLKRQQILIVFDDVWDGEFLQEMVNLFGSGVKCLVTSQRGDLCQGLNFSAMPIKIEVNQEHATKVLASHVGFSNQLMPEHLKDLADEMVREAEGNPLALALIATGIDCNRKNEGEEWISALGNFSTLLHSESTAYVLGRNYPKSFWAAVQTSIEDLNMEAKKLLVLTHLCDGQSVPEQVVHIFHEFGEFLEGPTTFEKLRKGLESRSLLKITQSVNFPKGKTWSVHSRLRDFINDTMMDLKESMLIRFTRLVDKMDGISGARPNIVSEFHGEVDAMIYSALIALYLNSQFAAEVASKMNIPIDRFESLRRNAVEPITCLLATPLSNRWTAAAHFSAKLVFLKYIYATGLHGDGILHLLATPISTAPMIVALRGMAMVERRPLLDRDTGGLLKALVDRMTSHDTSVEFFDAPTAICMIDCLSINRLHHRFIVSSGGLDAIVKLLSSEDSVLQLLSSETRSEAQALAANALLFLSDERETQLEIIHSPQALDVLVACLSNNSNYDLQTRVLAVLSNLSTFEEVKLKIAKFPSALQQLSDCLSEDNHPFQERALRLLFSMAETGDEEVNLAIIDCPGILHQLIQFLLKDNDPDRLIRVTGLLVYLATTNYTN